MEPAFAAEPFAEDAARAAADGVVVAAAYGNVVVADDAVGVAVGTADSASFAGDIGAAVAAGSVPSEDAASAAAVDHAVGCHRQPCNTDCSQLQLAEVAVAVGAAAFAVAAPELDAVSSAQLAAVVVSASQSAAEA